MKEYFFDITKGTEEDFAVWYSQMSSERKEKCRRLQQEQARRCCIAADQLARTAIAEWFNCPASEVKILVSPSGKPYLDGNPLYLSLSHSDRLVACAVCQRPVGIDVERIRPITGAMAERICTEQERIYWNAAETEEERTLRFLYLWTRKEAVFKLDGSLPRRDRETEVLLDQPQRKITTRRMENYIISIAEKNDEF